MPGLVDHGGGVRGRKQPDQGPTVVQEGDGRAGGFVGQGLMEQWLAVRSERRYSFIRSRSRSILGIGSGFGGRRLRSLAWTSTHRPGERSAGWAITPTGGTGGIVLPSRRQPCFPPPRNGTAKARPCDRHGRLHPFVSTASWSGARIARTASKPMPGPCPGSASRGLTKSASVYILCPAVIAREFAPGNRSLEVRAQSRPSFVSALSPDVESSIFESPGGGDCPDDLLGDTSVGLHGTLPPGLGLAPCRVHPAQLDKIGFRV